MRVNNSEAEQWSWPDVDNNAETLAFAEICEIGLHLYSYLYLNENILGKVKVLFHSLSV